MAKLFTITQGLENLGALKTGGQGSVYKGRRSNGTITAIKLLPTPIFNESEEDKNYRDFRNEVEKLKRVNQHPNPYVVKIHSWGITDTGNFPFIEMEFIEGPDLEELLKPPHDPIFSIKELMKVAVHLSNALAHCHDVDVKHGDIKSNNIKYNIHTGHYVLLDFGLAAMSDEQRRTSLRHAGAIEFMAPEQSEGTVLFQTDVYGFGIILYELIAGRVPFPLADKSESARNKVMLAHMETAPPDMLELRRQHLPGKWNDNHKKAEMEVPQWLLQIVLKCLQKDPALRFRDGRDLHQSIAQQINGSSNTFVAAPAVNNAWVDEKKSLQQQLHQQQKQIDDLRQQVITKDHQLKETRDQQRTYVPPPSLPPVQEKKGVSSGAFYALLLVTGLLAAFAVYALLSNSTVFGKERDIPSDTTETTQTQNEILTQQPTTRVPETPANKRFVEDTSVTIRNEEKPVSDPMRFDTADTVREEPKPAVRDASESKPAAAGVKRYKVRSKAYFHDEPDVATRRNAFIVHWNNAVLTPIDDKDGFVYIVFTNVQGQTSKGWILKSELIEIED